MQPTSLMKQVYSMIFFYFFCNKLIFAFYYLSPPMLNYHTNSHPWGMLICWYIISLLTFQTGLLHPSSPLQISNYPHLEVTTYLAGKTGRRNKEMTSSRCNDITAFRVHSWCGAGEEGGVLVNSTSCRLLMASVLREAHR